MEKFINTCLKVGITDEHLVLLDKSGEILPNQIKLTLVNSIGETIPGMSTCTVELLVDTREIKKIKG